MGLGQIVALPVRLYARLLWFFRGLLPLPLPIILCFVQIRDQIFYRQARAIRKMYNGKQSQVMWFVISIKFRIAIALIVVLCYPGLLFSQNTQLEYLKTDAAVESYFFPNGDAAYLRSFPNATTNAGLLPGDSYLLDPTYSDSKFHVVYDSVLNPLGYVEIKIEDFGDFRPLKKVNDHYFLYYGGYNYSGKTPFLSTPPLGENPPDSSGVYFLIDYDLAQNTLQKPFTCECPDYQSSITTSHIPYLNFRSQIGATSGIYESNNTMAWMNDGSAITTVNMFHEIILNAADHYSIDSGYQWGDVWVKINPVTGEYSAFSLISQNGTMLTNSLNASADGENLFRTGVLRGHDLQVSPDGTTWNGGTEDDSLFHAILLKEDLEGNHLWSSPLFSYENSLSSDTSNFSIRQFDVSPTIEINSDLYLGLYYRLDVANEQDSLYFEDFTGESGLYGKPGWFQFDPILPGFVAKSSREILRFNENGVPVGKLEFPIRDPDPWGYYNAGWYIQKPALFEVNNKLAWPLAYRSVNDTTLYILKKTVNQPLDSIGISLPAGSATIVFWIDEQLDIIDYTLFSYSNSGSLSQRVSISNIKKLNSDTLAIFGQIGNNTTTTLDPSGNADSQTYSQSTSFLALYSIPDFIVSAKHPGKSQEWSLYPNPANQSITFEGNYKGDVEFFIYDLSGRQLKSGRIHNGQQFYTINIEEFNAGMYIVSFKSEHRILTTGKFTVY